MMNIDIIEMQHSWSMRAPLLRRRKRTPQGSLCSVLGRPDLECSNPACFEEYHVVDGGTNSASTKSEVVETWSPVKG